MQSLQTQCQWPDLAPPYAQALREAVAYVLDRFEVLGIIASGSIVRGNPDPASDLDVFVIHARPQRQRIQKFFNGVRSELFVNPPQSVRGYFAEERKAGRPCTAHMLVTGFVVLDRDPVVATLRQEAHEFLQKRPDLSENRLTALRYSAADAYENAVDIASTDPANASLILHGAVHQMVRYAFLAANQPLPRDKEFLSALVERNPQLGALAQRYYLATDISHRFDLAEQIAWHTIGVTGFFEWESELEEMTY